MKFNSLIIKLMAVVTMIALLAACGGNENEGSSGVDNGASAENWPEENIELVVPFNAGGVSDILARSFVEASQGLVDTSVRVENRPGASGTVGNYEVVRAKPDGYTWLWASSGHVSSSLHITPAQYTMEDFTIVNKVGEMVAAIVVPKDSPFQTLDDYIQYAKEHPGELTAGNPGESTVVSLLTNLFEERADVQLNHVPFQGSGPLLPAVMGNHVMSAFMNVPEIRGQVQSGDLRVLAVLSEERIDLLPDAPTAAEQGVEGVAGGAGHFIVIPNDVPEAIVEKIDELTKQVYETDKFKELMLQAGYQIGYKNGEEARQELEEWYEITENIYRNIGKID